VGFLWGHTADTWSIWSKIHPEHRRAKQEGVAIPLTFSLPWTVVYPQGQQLPDTISILTRRFLS
jgi:hypothetical protein